VDIPGTAMNPKFEGQRCKGLLLTITDPRQFLSVEFGIRLICAVKAIHPDQFVWRSAQSALRLFGTDETPQAIDQGKSPEEIYESWHIKLDEFIKIRENYLLYE